MGNIREMINRLGEEYQTLNGREADRSIPVPDNPLLEELFDQAPGLKEFFQEQVEEVNQALAEAIAKTQEEVHQLFVSHFLYGTQFPSEDNKKEDIDK